MNQRLVALLTGLSMAAASALATQDSRLPLDQGAAPTSKPDFVFLLLDVMGQRGLGCGIREPMLVTRPGAVTPGSICDAPVTSTDLHPTMLATCRSRAVMVSALLCRTPSWRSGRRS